MSFLSSLFPGIGSALSLYDMFTGAAQEQQARQQQQQLLQQANSALNAQYAQTLNNNGQNVYQAAGLGGDALQAMGSRLGDSLAHAGVYNSSATAGALASAQQNAQARVATLADTLQSQAWQQRQNGLMQLAGMGLGAASQNAGYAGQLSAQGARSLPGYLSTLAALSLPAGADAPGGAAGVSYSGAPPTPEDYDAGDLSAPRQAAWNGLPASTAMTLSAPAPAAGLYSLAARAGRNAYNGASGGAYGPGAASMLRG